MSETVAIRSVRSGQNLRVDRSNHDVVTLHRAEDTDRLQQWIKFKADDGHTFKNVESGGYLCPDKNITNPDGVSVNATEQFVWLLLPVKTEDSHETHWTIRPSSASSSDNRQNITMEAELKPVKLRTRESSTDTTYLWDIVSVG